MFSENIHEEDCSLQDVDAKISHSMIQNVDDVNMTQLIN